MGVKLVDHDDIKNITVSMDLVVMSHVLEHVTNPTKFIKNATQNLRVGGAIFIEVPCRDWEHKPLDEPHVLFFDKKPMYSLLSKINFIKVAVDYFGQEISHLQQTHIIKKVWRSLRSRLISIGLVLPFASIRLGMESLDDPLERAVVAPYKAHIESTNPAWWLRTIAIKSPD